MLAAQRKRPAAKPYQQIAENRDCTVYIGNLNKRLTEYHVVKLFQPFGKVVRVQYMWSNAGEARGTPRGFCFLEFSNREEAARAAAELNQKVILGRPLVVRPASGDEADEAGVPATRKRGAGHSMLTVSDKIRAIEDKLKSMEQEHQAELAHSRMTSARIMQLLRSSSLSSATAATAASASQPADAANFLFEALAGHQSERAQQVDTERRVSAALDGVTDEPPAAATAAAPREQSSSSSRHRSRSPDRDHKRRDDDRHKDRHKDDRHKDDRHKEDRHKDDRHKEDKDRKHKDRDERRRSRSRSRGRDRRSRSRERR